DRHRLRRERAQGRSRLHARDAAVAELHHDPPFGIEIARERGRCGHGGQAQQDAQEMHVGAPHRSMPKPTPAERSSLLKAPPRLIDMRSPMLRAYPTDK